MTNDQQNPNRERQQPSREGSIPGQQGDKGREANRPGQKDPQRNK